MWGRGGALLGSGVFSGHLHPVLLFSVHSEAHGVEWVLGDAGLLVSQGPQAPVVW